MKDGVAGTCISSPKRLTAVASRVFFTAFTNGRELWVSDGSAAGTTFIKHPSCDQ